MTIQEYRESKRTNYSKLSALAEGSFNYYKTYIIKDTTIERDKKKNIGIILGTLLDLLVFSPNDFDKVFYIGTDTGASDTIKSILDDLYLLIKEKNNLNEKFIIENWKEEIYEIACMENYGKNWLKTTVINKVIEYGHNYFNDLKSASDKIIITFDTLSKIKQALLSLQENFSTKKIFSNALSNSIHIIYQLPIFWKAQNSFPCKSLLDIVIIDKRNKTILPIDLKGTSDATYNFPYNFIKWKYYLQASFYTDALEYWKENNEKAREFISYKILPFEFIVQGFHSFNLPMVYKCTLHDLKVGKEGGYTRTGKKVKGYSKLLYELEDLQNHQDRWDYGVQYYDNGYKYIDIFNTNVSNT